MNNVPLRKIGLMGGTFDPLHIGHLFIAENARVACGLEEVIFFPNGVPAHAEGKSATASTEIRLEMTRLATADNPYFRVSDIEIKREGKSFAFDTIQEFQQQLGAETELYFIVGADSMRDILTWYRGGELFELCRFVALTRPGFGLEAARAKLNDFQQSRVTWLEAPGLHIASRELRERVRNGQPIRYLVPDEVLNVIKSRKLYSS